jgi:DNA primase
MDPGLSLLFQEYPVPRYPENHLSAIKDAVDIVALVGEYLSLRRMGSKFKALCPFHNDHNPSLEVNPDRQSFKCWSCGTGGDVFDFVKNIERVEFPEALRMLADRAGIALEKSSVAVAERGPSKADLYAANAWAEKLFATALKTSDEVLGYLDGRGLNRESAARFRLGYAPAERGWLLAEARRDGVSTELLESAGLVSRPDENPGILRERFRGRLIFPIHDDRGRAVGFGGRVLPRIERAMAAEGKGIAKYLNTAETVLFRKRTLLYAADLAKTASRESGWVAVVEGYTDVVAAHQVGLANVVGTLGTALGADHLRSLRRLADRIVLVFDGDEAGQSAADRSLELFLSNELDLRVLTLPAGIDPCDFLLESGPEKFRHMAETAPDPLVYLVDRASDRFDIHSLEGSRRAAEWVLGIVASMPAIHRFGLEVKRAKMLDTLSHRLRVPVDVLNKLQRQVRSSASNGLRSASVSNEALGLASMAGSGDGEVSSPGTRPRLDQFDRTYVELIQIVLAEPTEAIRWLITRVAPATLTDEPLRAILQQCYDLHAEGLVPNYENLMARLEDSALRSLVTDLVAPKAMITPDSSPVSTIVTGYLPTWQQRLELISAKIAERDRIGRLNVLKTALDETDPQTDPDAYRAIQLEYRRLLTSSRTRK